MTSSTLAIATVALTAVLIYTLPSCHAFSTHTPPPSMWQILQTNDNNHSNNKAFHKLFGPDGSRGEYMDGYSPTDMIERCRDDYHWKFVTDDEVEVEREEMMSYLYDNPELWDYVSMVAFAPHYLPNNEDDDMTKFKAFHTFQTQKKLQPSHQPIFNGVIWNTWQHDDKLPSLFLQNNIDYVRLHCNFGDDFDTPSQLLSPDNTPLFKSLARATKQCQLNQIVPVILLQVPWRVTNAKEYFDQVMTCLASELKLVDVQCHNLILETRPPIGIEAQVEQDMSPIVRQELGYQIGCHMFQTIHQTFGETSSSRPVGYCVAGGSTKGMKPTAMQDDTQNAVRQGIREGACQEWGYEFCFWEMGAKLMLQPQVGRLWGNNDDGDSGRMEARELFCGNARGMADEIRQGL